MIAENENGHEELSTDEVVKRALEMIENRSEEEPEEGPETETENEENKERKEQIAPEEASSPGFRSFMDKIEKEPLLTAEEENALSVRIQKGDKAAMDEMVRHNMRLVASIAKHYAGHGLPMEDLVQEGAVGLMKAAVKYRPEKGCRFSTYATWWIRQAVIRGLQGSTRTVNLPAYLQMTIARYYKLQAQSFESTGMYLSDEEVMKALGITKTVYQGMMQWIKPIVSLQMPVGEQKDTELGDLIADPSALSVEDLCEKGNRRDMIRKALSNLTEKERNVIIMRFGLGGVDPMTLREIGTVIGVTTERVRQIQMKAMDKLKSPRNIKILSEAAEAEDY